MDVLDPLHADFWARIGIALLCGSIVGLERELRGKPTGMRTCVLICLGTAIFVRLGCVIGGDRGDASRVLGQVVTGIGFLGGGVIMSKADTIIGVTTASVVWTLAATGALIGAGHYAAAFACALVTVAVLVGLDYVERFLQSLR
jgi:putative Mg2+ transporter-C (MgtC) family protein